MIPWTRIEPDNSDPTLRAGARAELADPLWLLARQWQMGEFRGEDVGTPVLATLETATDGAQVLIAGSTVLPLHAGSDPVESLIEREAPAPPDVSLRLHGAMVFAELMAEARLKTFLNKCVALFPLRADASVTADAGAALAALAARLVDAEALLDALRDGAAALAGRLRMPRAKEAAFAAACARWAQWYGARRGVGGGIAWSDADAAHHAALRTGAGAELRIAAHRGGTLDWSAFDARTPVERAPASRQRLEMIPIPIQVPGTGSLRFWEMEDAQVDLGTLAAGSTEIARVLLGEFALLWAHDWFVVPVPVQGGAWTALPRIVVRDTFGVDTEVPSAFAGAGFGLWRHHGFVCAAAGLWVPTAAPLGSAPLDRLDLIVDEGSNLRWAHELGLCDELGFALQGAPSGASPPADDPPARGWRYRPFTPPPPGFVPLVERDGRLVPGELRLGDLPVPALRTPLAASLALRTDLLRSEGLSITRQWEVARAADGRLVAWIARRRVDQPPLTTAALVFDALSR